MRFRDICSNIFTFTDSWDDEIITPTTFRVFSKRHPAREALESFQNNMKRKHQNSNQHLRQRKSQDEQKSRFSHDWRTATIETSKQLDTKCRVPPLLLFEPGLVYSCTFNDK